LENKDKVPKDKTKADDIIAFLKDNFKNNSFITDYLEIFKNQTDLAKPTGAGSIEITSTHIEERELSGVSVTKLAEGIAKFLVERAKKS